MAIAEKYTQRKIIHVDMDAFYASIEMRDNPKIKDLPVIICADPRHEAYRRGVVSTCNYEARKYGVHSAMSAVEAVQKCPNGVFISPRMDHYKEVSTKIMAIFREYTDLVEPLSLDEAFLDVTSNYKNEVSATKLAEQIINQIKQETGLTASAGVSFNKFLAKVASDINKPFGITVVSPQRAETFIDDMKVNKIFGIGRKTAEMLNSKGFHTCKELKALTIEQMQELLHKRGIDIYHLIHNEDLRPVTPVREQKSVGKEKTFSSDIWKHDELQEQLLLQVINTARILTTHHLKARKVIVKIKYHDHTIKSGSRNLAQPTDNIKEIFGQAIPILENFNVVKEKPIRLLGVSYADIVKIDANGNFVI